MELLCEGVVDGEAGGLASNPVTCVNSLYQRPVANDSGIYLGNSATAPLPEIGAKIRTGVVTVTIHHGHFDAAL